MDITWESFDLFNPTEEHKLLRETVKSFVSNHVESQALEHNRKEIFNLSLFKKIAQLGLLGVTVPSEYGGSSFGTPGMDCLASVIIHEELSYSDPAFCLAYLAHSLLCVNNIYANGSEEQKNRYLPKLCCGEYIGAMGMSEAHAGTDVLNMKTFAQKTSEEGYVLNGNKMWITNGTIDDNKTPCDIALIYARTNPFSETKPKISTFIIEKNFSGFRVGQKITDKTGMRASNTAELVFENCFVPVNNLIGQEGNSITHMMRNLEIERIGLAAMSIGIARRALDIMVDYAKNRKAFNKKLFEFGQIQRMIGESYSELYAARSFIYNISRRYNPNFGNQRLDSDAVKLFATPIAKNIADRAIQVLGGNGYIGEYVVERLWRDSKLLEIGGGTLEAHQKNITQELIKK